MSSHPPILTAPELDGVFARVRSPKAYRAELERRIAKGRIRRELQETAPLHADIDCGRWVGRCPCGSGVALHPEWQYAACLGCGRTWRAVVFPDAVTLAAVERVLRCRPAGRHGPSPAYSWWHGESVEDLVAENRLHGWPVPDDTEAGL